MSRPPSTFVTFQGERRALSEVCADHKMDRRTVADRIAKGMSVEEALTRPTRKYRPKPTDQEPAVDVIEAGKLLRWALKILGAQSMAPNRVDGIRRIQVWLDRHGQSEASTSTNPHPSVG